jgi:hypothetical protein
MMKQKLCLFLISLAPARGRGYEDLAERSEAVVVVGEGESLRLSVVSTPAHIPTAVPLTLPRLRLFEPRRGSPLPRGRGDNFFALASGLR